MIMATSTFGKQFTVKREKASNFVKEMTRDVAPTLSKSFHSNMTHEKDVKDFLQKAIGKNR